MKIEKKRTLKVGKISFDLTNEEKILYPKDHITKKEVIDYYKRVAPFILPLIKNRPIVMHRFPNGIEQEGFFQKNASSYFPHWIKTKLVKRKEQESISMVLCNNVATLLYLASQACLTPHIWLSKFPKIKHPDRLIFDLDPPGKSFSIVREAAHDLREILQDLKLSSFLMTTGSKGLHIVVPIKPEYEFKPVREFARKIAIYLVQKKPKKYTVQIRKDARGRKLFLDYLRNGYAQTGAAPYALRALSKAPIATPVSWSEISSIHSQSFNIKNIFDRLSKSRNPWKGIGLNVQSLTYPMKKMENFF